MEPNMEVAVTSRKDRSKKTKLDSFLEQLKENGWDPGLTPDSYMNVIRCPRPAIDAVAVVESLKRRAGATLESYTKRRKT
jgi:hypothetical protein